MVKNALYSVSACSILLLLLLLFVGVVAAAVAALNAESDTVPTTVLQGATQLYFASMGPVTASVIEML